MAAAVGTEVDEAVEEDEVVVVVVASQHLTLPLLVEADGDDALPLSPFFVEEVYGNVTIPDRAQSPCMVGVEDRPRPFLLPSRSGDSSLLPQTKFEVTKTDESRALRRANHTCYIRKTRFCICSLTIARVPD